MLETAITITPFNPKIAEDDRQPSAETTVHSVVVVQLLQSTPQRRLRHFHRRLLQLVLLRLHRHQTVRINLHT